MTSETVLSIIPGSTESERLLLVLCTLSDHSSRVELRQQSHGDGIGWFTQATIRLEPNQVAELRAAIGTNGSNGPKSSSSKLPGSFLRAKQAAWQPRVVHADSA